MRSDTFFVEAGTVIASAKAYLNSLNKLHSKVERAHPQL